MIEEKVRIEASLKELKSELKLSMADYQKNASCLLDYKSKLSDALSDLDNPLTKEVISLGESHKYSFAPIAVASESSANKYTLSFMPRFKEAMN
ncbi:hypothetical protein ADUPG1_004504, partial [Aduncisulcus paluster]